MFSGIRYQYTSKLKGCMEKTLSESWPHVKFYFSVWGSKKQFARKILQSIRCHLGSFLNVCYIRQGDRTVGWLHCSWTVVECFYSNCVVPELSIHTSPTEGMFTNTPTHMEIPIKLLKFFLVLKNLLIPGNYLLWGSMDIFWNCTYGINSCTMLFISIFMKMNFT